MNLFVFYLLGALIGFLGLLACCVGILFAQPLVTLAWIGVYRHLNGR